MAVALGMASLMEYGDGEALKHFFLDHRLAHQATADAIVAQYGFSVPTFDTADEAARGQWAELMRHPDYRGAAPDALAQWLQLHALLHVAEFQTLGLGTVPELAQVNFADQGEFAEWMQAHLDAHTAAEGALGVTL